MKRVHHSNISGGPAKGAMVRTFRGIASPNPHSTIHSESWHHHKRIMSPSLSSCMTHQEPPLKTMVKGVGILNHLMFFLGSTEGSSGPTDDAILRQASIASITEAFLSCPTILHKAASDLFWDICSWANHPEPTKSDHEFTKWTNNT